MLEYRGLSVTIDEKKILDDITLSVKCGEVLALIGRNGSGKTTLLSSVLRERKYSGSIFVNGVDILSLSRKKLAKAISIMPQFLPSPDISVESLVSFGRSPHTSFSGILSENDRIHVSSAIDDMGLSHLRERKVSSLSGGECRRAYFAMILAADANVIMLDEPTTYMDTLTKKELFDFIRILKERHKAVIIVLHDLRDAVKVSDRIHLLDRGKTVFSGSATEFINSSYPREIFGLETVRIKIDGEEEVFFK